MKLKPLFPLCLCLSLSLTGLAVAESGSTAELYSLQTALRVPPVPVAPGDFSVSFSASDGRTVTVTVKEPAPPAGATPYYAQPLPGENDFDFFCRSIAAAGAAGASDLYFPRKTYTLNPASCNGSPARAHILLANLHDMTIHFNLSTLIFTNNYGTASFSPTHLIPGIEIVDSQRLHLEGATIDTNLPLAYSGMMQYDANSKQTYLQITEPGIDPTTIPQITGVFEWDTVNNTWRLNADAEVYLSCPLTGASYNASLGGFTSPSFNAFHLSSQNTTPVPVIAMPFKQSSATGIRLMGTSTADINVTGFTFNAVAGMAILATGIDRGVRVADCTIAPNNPGGFPARHIATTSDGFHFTSLHGDVVVLGNSATQQGDDFFNINGPLFPVTSVSTSTSNGVTVSQAVYHAAGAYAGIDVGDSIAVFDSKMNYVGTAIAQAIAAQGSVASGPAACPGTANAWQLTLSASFPSLAPGDVVTDMSRAGNGYYIRNNSTRYGLANGYRLQASNGYVGTNQISDMVMGGFNLMSDASIFFEGSGASNVTIANNTVTAVNQSAGLRNSAVAWNIGAISLSVSIPTGAPGSTVHANAAMSAYPLHQQDLVYENQISNVPYEAIAVSASAYARILENSVKQANTAAPNGGLPQYQAFLTLVNQVFCFPATAICSSNPATGAGESSLFWAYSSNGVSRGNNADTNSTTLGQYADPATTTNLDLQAGY